MKFCVVATLSDMFLIVFIYSLALNLLILFRVSCVQRPVFPSVRAYQHLAPKFIFRHEARHSVSYNDFFEYSVSKSVERRPVVRIGVPDTIVTVDNRKPTMATIVQIARTENQTEPGPETEATFFHLF